MYSVKIFFVLTTALFGTFLVFVPRVEAAHKRSVPVTIERAGKISSFKLELANDTGGAVVAVMPRSSTLVIGNGYDNSPMVRFFTPKGMAAGEFLAFDKTMKAGLTIAACDINGDGTPEIITGKQAGDNPEVRVYTKEGAMVSGSTFMAYGRAFQGGVNVACGDIDGDGAVEIVTAPGPTGGPHIRVWKLQGESVLLAGEYFDGDHTDMRGRLVRIQSGAIVTEPMAGAHAYGRRINTVSADIDNDGTPEKISVPGNFTEANPALKKEIVIDISDQRLYAYENGILRRSFFVSTGLYAFPTPIKVTSVLEKDPSVNYKWSYGPGNPNNYDLGVLPDNLRIGRHFFIHYAYWHKDFGHRRSHGCVNVNKENNKWIYNWADKGIRVEVRE